MGTPKNKNCKEVACDGIRWIHRYGFQSPVSAWSFLNGKGTLIVSIRSKRLQHLRTGWHWHQM